MSPRGVALLRTFRAAFDALGELEKTAPSEAAIIFETIVSHMRSSRPMAAASIPAPLPEIAPVESVERAVADGGRIRLTANGGYTTLDLVDLDGDRAVTTLEPAEVETLRADLASVGRGR